MYPLAYLLGFNNFKDGAWFEPSEPDRIIQAAQLFDLKHNDRVVDLGSGDGQVLIELAKHCRYVTGIEKDQKLVDRSRAAIKAAKLHHRINIIYTDMWHHSFSDYNKIYVYQVSAVMPRLEQKLSTELHAGAKVVSNYWEFPHWPVAEQKGDVRLYIKQ